MLAPQGSSCPGLWFPCDWEQTTPGRGDLVLFPGGPQSSDTSAGFSSLDFASLQVPQNFRHWGNLWKGEAPHPQQRLKRKVLRWGGGRKGEGLGKGVSRGG